MPKLQKSQMRSLETLLEILPTPEQSLFCKQMGN